MGYLKLTTSDIRMKAKVTPLPRSGEVNLRRGDSHRRRRTARLTCPAPTSCALAQIAQRFAPGAAAAPRKSNPTAAPVDAGTRQQAPQDAERSGGRCADRRFAAGMRTLIGVLILVALLPSALSPP